MIFYFFHITTFLVEVGEILDDSHHITLSKPGWISGRGG